MIAHFLLAAFMTAGFVAIPIGYKFRWSWTQNRRLRISHASVMGFITAETIVGLTCPLTVLEHSLRGDSPSQSFVSYWIKRILYWDLPYEIFIALYFLCFAWVIFLWKWCPPRKRLTWTRAWIWKFRSGKIRPYKIDGTTDLQSSAVPIPFLHQPVIRLFIQPRCDCL